MDMTGSQAKLEWSTRPGSQRADSNIGGYWITWTPMPGWPEAWHNAWTLVDGKTRNIEAGTREQCKAACERHFQQHSSSNNVSQAQLEL